jgi:hypothetical protein
MVEEEQNEKELNSSDFKKAAKFAKTIYQTLEKSSKPYHKDATNKWRKHYDSKPVRSNIDDDVLSKVFVDETYKACDRLSTRFKSLSPDDSDKFDCIFNPGGLEAKKKLNSLKSLVLNDLNLMGYGNSFKKAVEDYCVEGTMWTKLEWDMTSDRKMKIESENKKVLFAEKAQFPDGSIVDVPKEKEVTELSPSFYEESRDRGRMVPCRYDRVFVDVNSGEDLCETDLAHWFTTDFSTLERLEYDKSTGEGIYHNVKKLKDTMYEKLSEEDSQKKVQVELVDVWAHYDIDGSKSPELCLITISKDYPDICVRVDKDPYKLGHKPFYKTVLFRRPGKQLGKGIPEMVWNAQVQLNDAQTIIYQNAMRRGYGMGFYSMTAGLTKKQMRMRPGKMIGVSDPNNAYKSIQFEDVSKAMLAVSNILRNDISSHHGVSSSLGGEAPSGVDTAHEFERLLQMSTEKIKDFLSNVESTTIEPFLNDYMLLLFYNWEDYSERVAPVIGEESAGLQKFVKENVFDTGFETIKFRCLGAMKMEHDAVTNKRVFDTYAAFREDGTVPPTGKWKMKADVIKSLHPDITQKEILEYLGPMPSPEARPFVPPPMEKANQGGQNIQSVMNQGIPNLSNEIKASTQTENVAQQGVGQ